MVVMHGTQALGSSPSYNTRCWSLLISRLPIGSKAGQGPGDQQACPRLYDIEIDIVRGLCPQCWDCKFTWFRSSR